MISKASASDYYSNIKEYSIYLDIFVFSLIPLRPLIGIQVFQLIFTVYLFINIFLILYRKKIKINFFSFVMILFVIISGISVVYSEELSGVYYGIVRLLPLNLYGFILVQSILYKSKMNVEVGDYVLRFLKGYTTSTIIVCLYLLLIEFPQLGYWGKLGSLLFAEEGLTVLSYHLIISMLFCIYSFIEQKNPTKKLIISMSLILLFTVAVITSVRKAIIGPLLFAVLYSLVKNKKNFLKLMLSLLVLICLIVAILYLIINNKYLYDIIGRRFLTLINSVFFSEYSISGYIDSSAIERSLLRKNALEVFYSNPIIGIGLDNFKYYTGAHGTSQVYAHNNYLELLANLGIIGFCLFYVPIIKLLFEGVRKYKYYKSSIYLFISCFIITQLFLDYGTVSYYSLYHIPVLYIMSTISNNEERFAVEGVTK